MFSFILQMKNSKFSNQELQVFIDKASENCYLGEFKKAEIIERQGAFEMEYTDGDWNYRDSFFGFYESAGQELVRLKGIPVWASSYAGGVIEKYIGDEDFFEQLEKFLIKSLSQDGKNILRGPDQFIEGDWRYECNSEGDISQFNGIEYIYHKDEKVFHHRFFGGLIIGKKY